MIQVVALFAFFLASAAVAGIAFLIVVGAALLHIPLVFALMFDPNIQQTHRTKLYSEINEKIKVIKDNSTDEPIVYSPMP